MDPGLNSLLKWSVENTTNGEGQNQTPDAPRNGLNEQALRALMGGPSDADLMKQAMTVIMHPEATEESRMIAFDNFEQLVENIDNANNMEPLGLWTPLIRQLEHAEADMRRMAAWCVGTAVQNNVKAQERLLAINGIPILCHMAVNDQNPAARKKAIYALSSSVRNYQPSMNEAVKYLPKDIVGQDDVSATNMDDIDEIMTKLRSKN